VVTDLAEVLRLGTAKAKENLAFRRYLSAHHYSDKPFQILATEVQQQVDCTACANCCRHSVVSVNKSEIENIASHIGATPEEVIRLYTVPDPDAPTLRILLNSGEECVFLDGNLCMIYEARPKTCRDFPHLSVGQCARKLQASHGLSLTCGARYHFQAALLNQVIGQGQHRTSV
jgi:Fe-S-cluster containining protein